MVAMSYSPKSDYSSGEDNLTIELNGTKKDFSKSYFTREKSEEGIEEDSMDKNPDIQEQMYKDKLSQLHALVQELSSGNLPDYKEKIISLEVLFKERESFTNACYNSDLARIEREFLAEKELAAKEYEEKKAELKENLLLELEEKRKIIEQERFSLELTGDSMEYKPVSTRKLRRRGNEPPPMVEKRRKPMTMPLQLLLDEANIEDDVKIITKGKVNKKSSTYSSTPEHVSNEPRIENGKLLFDKKWFYKGQSILIECKDGSRFNGDLNVITNDLIIVRKIPENTRIKITLAQLAHGKYLVKKWN